YAVGAGPRSDRAGGKTAEGRDSIERVTRDYSALVVGTISLKGRNAMRITICLSALLLCASSVQADAKTVAKHAAFQLKETTWTYVDHGKKVRESIDADGNYIENTVGGKHVDHGIA